MVIAAVKLEMHLLANTTLSHDNVRVTWLEDCGQLNLSHILLKLVATVLAKVEIKLFKKITWSHDQWVRWISGWDTLNQKGYSKRTTTKIYMYYKLGQACVINWGSFVLLQIRANVVTNLQIGAASLLQIGTAITNQGNRYYKIG